MTEPAGVNLRGGPGVQYQALDIVPMGTELPMTGPKVNDDWIPVTYHGNFGFVFDQYVTVRGATASTAAQTGPQSLAPGPLGPGSLAVTPLFAPAPTPTPSPSPSAPPSPAASPAPSTTTSQQLRVNSPEGLNLRPSPSTDNTPLTVIAHNTRLTIGQRTPDGKWAQVTYNGQTGWVDTTYLAAIDDRAANPGAAASTSKYIWPVAGRSITTYFGPDHPGIDIDQFNSAGGPVVAAAAGRVSFAGGTECCSYGLYVTITHADGALTLYAHLSVIQVREGQEVQQGQVVGLSGNTGRSTGPHVHFELHVAGVAVDPLLYLPPASTPQPSTSPATSPSPAPRPSGAPSPSPSPSPSAPSSPGPGR